MTSGGMMIFLIGFYLLTSMVSGIEGNWPRVLYWLSAAGITSAVLLYYGGRNDIRGVSAIEDAAIPRRRL